MGWVRGGVGCEENAFLNCRPVMDRVENVVRADEHLVSRELN